MKQTPLKRIVKCVDSKKWPPPDDTVETSVAHGASSEIPARRTKSKDVGSALSEFTEAFVTSNKEHSATLTSLFGSSNSVSKVEQFRAFLAAHHGAVTGIYDALYRGSVDERKYNEEFLADAYFSCKDFSTRAIITRLRELCGRIR